MRKSNRENQKISLKRRKRLIRLVLKQKWTVKRAGQELCFKQSTAKKIVSMFKQTGHLTIFKYQKEKVQKKASGIKKPQRTELEISKQKSLQVEKSELCLNKEQSIEKKEENTANQTDGMYVPFVFWNEFQQYYAYFNEYNQSNYCGNQFTNFYWTY